jgi:hypothetical protein
MAYTVYVENSKKEQYKIQLEDLRQEIIDELLDQLQIMKPRYISEAEFQLKDPMNIDILEPVTHKFIGTLVCENFNH